MQHPLRLLRYVVLAILAAAILSPAPAVAGDDCVFGTGKMRAAEARLLNLVALHPDRFLWRRLARRARSGRESSSGGAAR